MVFILALFIFVGVEGTLIYSLFRYKARRGRTAAQIHGNTKLEVGWTVGAFLILIFITFFTFIKLGDIKNPQAVADQQQRRPGRADRHAVRGDQPDAAQDGRLHDDRGQRPAVRVALQLPRQEEPLLTYTDMVVPVGMTVILDITADDVVHSWWIPQLGGKMDAVPATSTRLGSGSPWMRFRRARRRWSMRDSARSSAAATTRTCTGA